MKRPACFSVADRRVSKLRDVWGQPCRRHVEPAGAKDALRPTVEDETQGALRSRCPAEEAINSNRKTSAQREKDQRQTSTARLVPSGRRTNVKLQPPDWCPRGEGPTSNFNRRTGPRTKDQCQLRRFGPRCVRRTNVKLRIDSIPSWEALGLPVQQGSRTQVSMVGNRGKSLTTHPLLPRPTPPGEGFRHPFRRLPPKCSQKFTTKPAHVRPVYRRHRPRVRTRLAHRRSSCCFSALRVS